METTKQGLREEAQGAETQKVMIDNHFKNQLQEIIFTDFQREKIEEISKLIAQNKEREFNSRGSEAAEHFLGRYQAAEEFFNEIINLDNYSLNQVLNSLISQVRAKILIYGNEIFKDPNAQEDKTLSENLDPDN